MSQNSGTRPSVVLCTLNARYIHASLGLRYLLANLDAHRAELWPVFEQAYGKDQARRWFAYWRIFFLSCAELFGYRGGTEWFVSHYLFARR